MARGSWRVAVWGGDDEGLELDVATEQEAVEVYDRMPDPLSRAWLEQRGFQRV